MRIVDGWPALLVEKPVKTLLISDIHFGFEAELAEKGIHIPSQTWKLRDLLLKLIRETSAERVIVLGDLKHQVPLSSWIEWREMPKVLRDLKEMGVEILLVPGNHDGGIEAMLGDTVSYHPSRGMLLDAEQRIFIFHGHTWPSGEAVDSDVIVMGHLHPMVSLRTDVGVALRKRVWLLLNGDRKLLGERLGVKSKRRSRLRLVVMPAFNPMLTGISVNTITPRDRLWPLMRSGAFKLEEAEAITLTGERLGSVGELRRQLFGEVEED